MKSECMIAFLIAGALPVLAQAPTGQPQQSMKGVVRKNLAPVSNEILRVKLPRPVESKLKNGLKVVAFENHRVPSVSIDLLLAASPLGDPPDLPGLAEAAAAMLKQGTTSHDARQIAEKTSELGGSISVMADYGAPYTHIYASALSENLEPLLALVADVLLNPTFPQDELEKWKKRKLASLEQNRSSEYFLGAERLHRVLYPSDARANITATPEAVKKITRENLFEFHKTHYRPGNALLGVTGDVTPEAMAALLEKYLGGWSGEGAALPKLPLEPPLPEKKIYLVDRPNSVQTYLMLANRAIDRLSPDYIACTVMNRVLGAGPASRLFIILREEKGFTYGVGSGFMAAKYMNYFGASSSVRTEVTGPAIDEFLNQFRRIREEPVPKEELDNAKRAIVASFALSLENQNGVLRQMLTLYEYGLPADYWDTYPAKVMAVTAEDIRRVARKYVPLDNVQLLAVGNAGKIRDLVRKYGPLEEYDTEGRKKE